jgi:hypothetical protein
MAPHTGGSTGLSVTDSCRDGPVMVDRTLNLSGKRLNSADPTGFSRFQAGPLRPRTGQHPPTGQERKKRKSRAVVTATTADLCTMIHPFLRSKRIARPFRLDRTQVTRRISKSVRCRLASWLNLHPKKAADNPAASPCIEPWSIFSVAVGTDSDADTRGMNADAAALPIAATLVTLVAGSISIRIMGLANNDAAFTTSAPATA